MAGFVFSVDHVIDNSHLQRHKERLLLLFLFYSDSHLNWLASLTCRLRLTLFISCYLLVYDSFFENPYVLDAARD